MLREQLRHGRNHWPEHCCRGSQAEQLCTASQLTHLPAHNQPLMAWISWQAVRRAVRLSMAHMASTAAIMVRHLESSVMVVSAKAMAMTMLHCLCDG